MTALDYMIAHDLWEYRCDPWCAEPVASNYMSASGARGQVEYRGETFVVQHIPGREGRGGMDEGSPPSVSITRVRVPLARKELWLCGQAKSEDGRCWEFQGIFSTKEKAIAACRHEWYFIAPVELDAELPDETVEMAGAYYPLGGDGPA